MGPRRAVLTSRMTRDEAWDEAPHVKREDRIWWGRLDTPIGWCQDLLEAGLALVEKMYFEEGALEDWMKI